MAEAGYSKTPLPGDRLANAISPGSNNNLSQKGAMDPPLSGDSVELQRTIGLFSGVGLILGVIVGSGIFVSPTGVLMESGSVGSSLVIWTVCGLLVLVGALCFAELGASITRSGGMYAYIHEAFGDCAGFVYMWSAMWIIFPAANAAIAVTCAQYLLYPMFPSCDSPESARRLIAAAAILLLTFVNCVSVRLATRIQDIFTVIKVLALVMIIITGLYALVQRPSPSFQNSFEGSSKDPGKISLAFYSGMFSYSGWYTLNFLTEELKNPYQNLIRAIWISMPLATAIYVLVNVAYFAVLTPDAILYSEAVAVTFAEVMYGKARWIMPIFVAFSTFGTLNGCILSISRIFFVGARQGHLPQGLALISVKKLTPMPAVILEGVASVGCLCIGDIFVLINCVSAIEALAFAVCMAALLNLRRTQPDLPRPIKVNLLMPITFMVVNIFMLVLALWEKPYDSGIGLVVTLTGIPVYWVGVMWKEKPHWLNDQMDKLTIVLQKILLSVGQIKEH